MEHIQQWNATSLETTRQHIMRAQTELEKVVETAHLAAEVPVGFHPDVNRRLLGPLPPRPVQVGSAQHYYCYESSGLGSSPSYVHTSAINCLQAIFQTVFLDQARDKLACPEPSLQ